MQGSHVDHVTRLTGASEQDPGGPAYPYGPNSVVTKVPFFGLLYDTFRKSVGKKLKEIQRFRKHKEHYGKEEPNGCGKSLRVCASPWSWVVGHHASSATSTFYSASGLLTSYSLNETLGIEPIQVSQKP